VIPLQLAGDSYVRTAPEYLRKGNIVQYDIDCLAQATTVAWDETDE
jgi:hypothetical protein